MDIRWIIGLCIAVLIVLVIAGCRSRRGDDVVTDGSFGRFTADVAEVHLLADGRNSRLTRSFGYQHNSVAWQAPAGEIVDGASIPRLFWSVLGGPYEGKYRFASIVHDRYCKDGLHGGHTWEQVHLMFYHACLAGKTDRRLAKIMYAAVYHFGPRWGDDEKGYEELDELILPEQERIAAELQSAGPPRRDGEPERTRRSTEVSEQEYVAAVLAPRQRGGPRDVPERSTLAKWERIRAYVRNLERTAVNEEAVLAELRAIP